MRFSSTASGVNEPPPRFSGHFLECCLRNLPEHMPDCTPFIATGSGYPPAAIRDSTSPSVIESFTPDRVCGDVLAVADAGGANRFAYYGFSWGGVVGLQLATRTDRLSALICAGWPPLGAPYKDMATAAGQPIYTTFDEHLTNSPDRQAVSKTAWPRLTSAGREDVSTTPAVTAPMGPLIAEHRDELERPGWRVRLVD